MWRKVPRHEEDNFMRAAVEFTGNAELYGQWMRRVVSEWPIACEHNLTDLSINRKAWVGHAATQMAINCPEYITRAAWGQLSEQQRIDANKQAQHAIDLWEAGYVHNQGGQTCLRLI